MDDIVDRSNHELHIIRRHARVNRERNRFVVYPAGNGKIGCRVSIGLAIVRMQVEWDEVNARADVSRLQLFNESVSINCEPFLAQPNDVQMPRVAHSRTGPWANDFRSV